MQRPAGSREAFKCNSTPGRKPAGIGPVGTGFRCVWLARRREFGFSAAGHRRIISRMSDEERQIVVFSDARPALANMVRNRLAKAGIEAFVENETLWQAAGDLPGGAITPRVVVAEIDAAARRNRGRIPPRICAALTISHRGREHRPARVVEEMPAAEPPPSEIAICPGAGSGVLRCALIAKPRARYFRRPINRRQDWTMAAWLSARRATSRSSRIYYRRCRLVRPRFWQRTRDRRARDRRVFQRSRHRSNDGIGIGAVRDPGVFQPATEIKTAGGPAVSGSN